MTQRLVTPQPERLNYIRFAFRRGMTVREVARMTAMDPWFLFHIKEITDTIATVGEQGQANTSPELLRKAKRMGVSDERIAEVWSLAGADGVEQVRQSRNSLGVKPVFKLVDTCAAEFESHDALSLFDL